MLPGALTVVIVIALLAIWLLAEYHNLGGAVGNDSAPICFLLCSSSERKTMSLELHNWLTNELSYCLGELHAAIEMEIVKLNFTFAEKSR